MPLAKIHVLEGRYDERRLGTVSKAVQEALIRVLKIPSDDFFQIIHVLPRNRFLHTPAWLGLKYSDGLTRFWPTAATLAAIALSFGLMALALRSLPFGTAYAVWTGIGAVGSILVGMLVYSEPTDPVRILCLTLIVAGMVGLKLNSPV